MRSAEHLRRVRRDAKGRNDILPCVCEKLFPDWKAEGQDCIVIFEDADSDVYSQPGMCAGYFCDARCGILRSEFRDRNELNYATDSTR